MKRNLLRLLVVAAVLFGWKAAGAQTVDTLVVHSPSMNKDLKNLVILPAGYDGIRNYPVVYLLHGYGNRFDNWLNRTTPQLPQAASFFDVILVCANGENSWYWDSPKDPRSRFETYISRELPAAVDARYRTVKSREGRAVTGYSMGGHGALWIGFRHPDAFGACGSMSGGVDIRPFPDNWEIATQLGRYDENPEVWDDHTVINQIWRIRPGRQAILIDCGSEDFFHEVNEELHRQLLYRNIPHDYIVRPGAHTHPYWRNAIDYQLLFFRNYFNRKAGNKYAKP